MRLRGFLAAVAVTAAAAPSAALADVGDGPAAITANVQDLNTARGQAAKDLANVAKNATDVCADDYCPSTPAVACTAEADGSIGSPEQNLVVGKTYAQDLAVGSARCVSLTTASYSVTLELKLQYFDGTWRDIAGCPTATSTADADRGVAVVPATTLRCDLGDMSPYLDSYHRAVATITNSIFPSSPRRGPSAAWYQSRG